MGASASFDIDLSKKMAEESSKNLLENVHVKGHDLFLNIYTKEDLMSRFFRYLYPKLSKEFDREGFIFTLDSSDPFVHSLSVTHKKLGRRSIENDGPSSFILKLFVKRAVQWDWKTMHLFSAVAKPCEAFNEFMGELPEKDRDIHAPFEGLKHMMDCSILEYVYLQNPLKDFTEERKQLPNQKHPGLGVGKEFMKLVVSAGKDHKRDLLINYPEQFHNAFIYYFKAGMTFLSPHCQAFFELMVEDLTSTLRDDFAGVAWAVFENRLYYKDIIVIWPSWEQVMPLSPTTKDFVKHNRSFIEHLKKHLRHNHPKNEPLFTIKSAD